MKAIYKLSILFLAVLLIASCEEDLTDLNEDTKNPTEIPGEPLFTNAQKNLSDYLVSTNVNENVFRLVVQYWTETTYTDETNYRWVERNIPEQEWDYLYRDVIKDLNESIRILNNEEPASDAAQIVNQNKRSIAEIHRVWAYSMLVESFGNVPYSEALNIETIYPKYDDAATIYNDLLSRLDQAISNLDASQGSFGNADNIYSGDVAKWEKFGNSLMLRMAMMLADSDMPTSVQYANSALEGGIFESNADNAEYQYLSTSPNTNPLYVDLVASGRKDFVPANTFVNAMNERNDPRRSAYFDQNLTDDDGNPIYDGGIYGQSNSYPNYTHITPTVQEPEYPGTLLSYSEVEFLKAEAVARGGYDVMGSAESHYTKAIVGSFQKWGLSDSEAMDYISNEAPYDAANWEQSIGIQAWIAMYNRGYAAWNFWRRLDYPQLEAPPDAEVDEVPVRMFYPIVEQTLNPTGYNAAVQAIGGDNLTNNLFFDID